VGEEGLEMLNIISLGAGVQSSTMALMAAAGEITPMPKCAIFADTGDEPKSVYTWLNWLEMQLPFPVVRPSIGKLSLAITTARVSKAKNGYMKPSIPVFFDNGGMGQRHCTMDFKLVPIYRFANLIRGKNHVNMWIGISMDESERMKPSGKQWADTYFPLIDKQMSRQDCVDWMLAKGFPKPPRSACIFCPYHSDDEWIRLRDDEPEEFAKAIAFEKAYQETAAKTALNHIPFLHDSRMSLETVTLVPGRGKKHFSNECEGMCGV
jgi:hypothetical protein